MYSSFALKENELLCGSLLRLPPASFTYLEQTQSILKQVWLGMG